MGIKVVNGGDSDYRTPGTCNQTGNDAPKYPWAHSPVGRVAKVSAILSAYHLGYTDHQMATLHKLPPAVSIARVFDRLLPWFGDHYDRYRRYAAKERNYDGPLEPYNPYDVENRVRCCFVTPGSRRHTRDRKYGFSVEHPSVSEQQYKLRITWVRCSEEIERRIKAGLTVDRTEAYQWGQLP